MRLRFYSCAGASMRWAWRFSVNQKQTFRQRIAWRLRNFADRLDRFQSIAVRFQTMPQLTRQQKIEVMRQGTSAMERALIQEVKYSAEESLLARELPFLWKEDTCK